MGLDIYWYRTDRKDGYFRRYLAKCEEVDEYKDFLYRKHKDEIDKSVGSFACDDLKEKGVSEERCRKWIKRVYEDFGSWTFYTRQEAAIADALDKDMEALYGLIRKDELPQGEADTDGNLCLDNVEYSLPNRKNNTIAQWVIGKNKDRQVDDNGRIGLSMGTGFLSKADVYELVQKLNRISDAAMLEQTVDKEFPVVEGMLYSDRTYDHVVTKEDWKTWRDSFTKLYGDMTEDEELVVELFG